MRYLLYLGFCCFSGQPPHLRGMCKTRGLMCLAEQRAPAGLSPSIAHGVDGHCHGNPPAQSPRAGPRGDQLCSLTSKRRGSPSPCLSNQCPWVCLATHPPRSQSFSSRLQPGRLWRAPSLATSCKSAAPSVASSFACGLQTSRHALPVAWLCHKAALIADNFSVFIVFVRK